MVSQIIFLLNNRQGRIFWFNETLRVHNFRDINFKRKILVTLRDRPILTRRSAGNDRSFMYL